MQDLVINAKNLNYGQVLQGLNFSWRQGETVALVGPNGSGKTTLARLIAGLIEPTTGVVTITDKDIPLNLTRNGRWQAVGLIGQHPRRQTIGASVAEELSFGLINLGLPNDEVKYQVREIIRAIGLEAKGNQSPATLSGGERQRLVVAAVLAMKPQFIIFDEALSMLDIRSQERILQLVDNMGSKAGKLWITHDSELAAAADRLWLLHDGQLRDAGRPEHAFADPKVRQKFYIRNRCSGLEARTKREKVKTGPVTGKFPKLQWDDFIIAGRLKLSKTVEAGEFVGIVGASGSGKSTLLESAVGLTASSEGQIRIEGMPYSTKNLPALRRKIRILLQEAGEYLLDRTVRDTIFWAEKELESDTVSRYLERLHIDPELLSRSPETLSGGERQKVALAAALRTEPDILLLDEPMLGLDAQSREAVSRVLNELRSDVTVLYVTHDLCEVLPYADRLWLVEKGEVVRDCPAEEWNRYYVEFQKGGVRLPVQSLPVQES